MGKNKEKFAILKIMWVAFPLAVLASLFVLLCYLPFILLLILDSDTFTRLDILTLILLITPFVTMILSVFLIKIIENGILRGVLIFLVHYLYLIMFLVISLSGFAGASMAVVDGVAGEELARFYDYVLNAIKISLFFTPTLVLLAYLGHLGLRRYYDPGEQSKVEGDNGVEKVELEQVVV